MNEYMHSPFRPFDIDDLFILAALAKNTQLNKLAKALGLTPPAISHRLNKYRKHFSNFDLTITQTGAAGKNIFSVSPETLEICKKADKALKLLMEDGNDKKRVK